MARSWRLARLMSGSAPGVRLGTCASILAMSGWLLLPTAAHAGWGFVYADRPTATASVPYTPAVNFQFNSSGATNTVTRFWQGHYEVVMPFVVPLFHEGNVQVTAYGLGSAYCKVRSWARRGNNDLVLTVNCYEAGGPPVDTRFTALYHDKELDPENLAYTWMNVATHPGVGHIPPELRTHNARSPGDPGGDLWVSRIGAGRYFVFIHGWTEKESSVLVTAHTGSNTRCSVEDDRQESAFVPDHGFTVNRRMILVACVRPDGTLADSTFTVSYANERNLGSAPRSVGAYLMADLPTRTTAYAPLFSRSFNAAGGGNQIQRTGPGVYVVTLGLLAGRYTKSTVLVTARGPGGAHCKVSSWFAPAPDVRVIVACFDVTGAPVDSQFFVTFLTNGTL